MKSFRHRLHIARGLTWADWLWMIEAWWGLLANYLALRRKSFESLVVERNNISLYAPPSLPAAQRLHQLVAYASRLHLLPMTCLPQSLALRNMLGRRGIAAEIKIGAKKTAQGIHAHAWVEVEGVAVGEENVEERFQPLRSAGE